MIAQHEKLKKLNQLLAEVLTPDTILGRVYQLYLIDQQETGLKYYGSTIRTLAQRFAEHKRDWNLRKNKQVVEGGVSSYKLFEKGQEKVRIRQLYCGIFPSLSALRQEEDKWVTSRQCVNKLRPLQSLREQISRLYYHKVVKPKKQKMKAIKKEERMKTQTPLQARRRQYNKRNYEKNLKIFLQCPMCYNTLPKAHMYEHKKTWCRNKMQAEGVENPPLPNAI